MALRRVRLDEVQPFELRIWRKNQGVYGRYRAQRRLAEIGLTIQTIAPDCRSSRRHRHVFQRVM
jgi:hypothetical protein